MAVPTRRPPLLGPLGRRLAAASVAIAFASIAVLTGLTLLLFDLDIGNAAPEPEDVYATALASGLRSAYAAADGWQNADLSAPIAIAQLQGFGLVVTAGNRTILSVSGISPSRATRIPVSFDQHRVGEAVVTIPQSGLTPAESSLRKSLGRAVAIAAAVAAALALAAALLGTRVLVAPLRRLTLAASRLGAGDRSSRVGQLRAPGEITQLAAAFDTMADDLARTDQLRRDLVADVAHELRTPIAILRAQLEAVEVGIESLSGATVRSLEDEVGRLGRLVEDLGVLSAAEAAGLSLQRLPVDLAEVADVAADRLESRFGAQGVALARELATAFVLGDRGRLEQVVVNLLSNAAKFSPQGGTVVLGVARSGREAELTVSDEGPGIPPEEQHRLFERFYQGSGAAPGSGSGVGLAVVAAIVTAHGGGCRVESEPGTGSTFAVSLPLLNP